MVLDYFVLEVALANLVPGLSLFSKYNLDPNYFQSKLCWSSLLIRSLFGIWFSIGFGLSLSVKVASVQSILRVSFCPTPGLSCAEICLGQVNSEYLILPQSWDILC